MYYALFYQALHTSNSDEVHMIMSSTICDSLDTMITTFNKRYIGQSILSSREYKEIDVLEVKSVKILSQHYKVVSHEILEIEEGESRSENVELNLFDFMNPF